MKVKELIQQLKTFDEDVDIEILYILNRNARIDYENKYDE